MAYPLRPTLPEVGDRSTLFGLTGTVTAVEPQDDWNWAVTIEFVGSFHTSETTTVLLPTDFRTTDGMPAYGV